MLSGVVSYGVFVINFPDRSIISTDIRFVDFGIFICIRSLTGLG